MNTNPMSPAAKMGHAIDTQDNRMTSHPIYFVRQRRRVWGMDTKYSRGDDIAWLDNDDLNVVPDELAEKLESKFRDDGIDEPDGHHRMCYRDIWEIVQPFFTQAAADEYLGAHAHNLNDPHVYVASGHANPEWQFVRELPVGATRG